MMSGDERRDHVSMSVHEYICRAWISMYGAVFALVFATSLMISDHVSSGQIWINAL